MAKTVLVEYLEDIYGSLFERGEHFRQVNPSLAC